MPIVTFVNRNQFHIAIRTIASLMIDFVSLTLQLTLILATTLIPTLIAAVTIIPVYFQIGPNGIISEAIGIKIICLHVFCFFKVKLQIIKTVKVITISPKAFTQF